MKTTTTSIVALAAIPLFAAVGTVAAADVDSTKTNDNNSDNANRHQHRSLSRRHWATLIPPSRVAALTLDDAHIHAPPSSSTTDGSSNTNYASSAATGGTTTGTAAQSLIEVPRNPNPTSPHSISSQLEMAHDDAVSTAIQAGASINQIENLAYGGGVVSTASILDASGGDSYNPTNRVVNPALEYSPHIFDLTPSQTQPWITSDELDKFVGGVQNLRPDINEWLDVVLPEMEMQAGGVQPDGQPNEDDGKITLDEILQNSAAFSGIVSNTNTNANANPGTAANNQGAALAGGYTIDPVTGVYLDSNGMVIADPAAFGIGNTNPSGSTTVGSITFPGPSPPAVPATPNFPDIKNTSPTQPSNYPDPTIQGGVQLHHSDILPYPLSLPWYPKDGRPWVDPVDLPTISGKSPVLDAINAAPSSEVKQFIRNSFWEAGYWTEDNFFSYGPPCSVAEVVEYNEQMIAQGRLQANNGAQITGRVGKNGKINGGQFIPGLHVVGNGVARGALGRCEGDCDEGGQEFFLCFDFFSLCNTCNDNVT